ncbi:winged helix-turn-helix domain-containing protein [Bdellovibrio bacteriovorus]|uniref:winged helix-turn-helix domain-containing protein n=1 Tax=Bdellovibrio bacteriovorus TaxID=959 RepID=UPI0012FBE4F6|nr:winged helix-turn-helix domain-containing protein [Bdellovibrio bacteriovorus]
MHSVAGYPIIPIVKDHFSFNAYDTFHLTLVPYTSEKDFLEFLNGFSKEYFLPIFPILAILPLGKNIRADFLDKIINVINLSDDADTLELEVRRALKIVHILRSVPQILRLGNLSVNTESKRVFIKDTELKLFKKEYQLLLELARRKNQVVPVEELTSLLWPKTSVSAGNLPTQVYNLKQKLKDFSGCLQTIPGEGVVLKTDS